MACDNSSPIVTEVASFAVLRNYARVLWPLILPADVLVLTLTLNSHHHDSQNWLLYSSHWA